MDPARWKRAQEIFHRAVERPPAERDAFVRAVADGDADLEAQVRAMLAEDGRAGDVLDAPVGAVADALLDDGRLPERIGPYRLVRRLGEGGMGVVHLAERDDVGTRVAIKFLRDARLSAERQRRFLRERRFLARLDHPAIARLHDAGALEDGTPYFVMEYVDGEPLTDYCARRALGIRERLELFRRVCAGVSHAHRQALIHRDLKPSNILARDGQVKLLDFGIAKPLVELDAEEGEPGAAGSAGATATRTGFAALTPAYAAPEQLRGEPVGVGADVYALGVILYELLTGARPYDVSRCSPYEAARLVTTQDPRRPSSAAAAAVAGGGEGGETGRRAWADLDVLCLTAMQRDVERRYPSVEALLRDVDHYLRGEPLVARGDRWSYRAAKFIERHRRALLAAGAVGAAVVALTAFYTVRLSAARDAAREEADRTARIQRFMLDLFEGGDDVAGPRQGLTVETLIERGVRRADALEADPDVQAELRQTLGGVYRRMAELDRAEEQLRAALESRRARLGARHPEVAETLSALGLVLADRGELEEAEATAREAAEIAGASLPARHPLRAETLRALGEVLQRRGRYPEAVEALERAVAIQETRDDPDGLIAALGALADTHNYAGDHETSIALNRRLLELIEARQGTRHPAYAGVLIGIAASRRALGDPAGAEPLYRQALAIHEAYYGREHPTTASNLGLLGASLVEQGRPEEALGAIESSLAVRESVYGPDHYQVALTLNQLARAHYALGDLDRAETMFARELALYRQTFGDDHPFTATGLSNVASLQYRRGDHAAAAATMRRSLATFERALAPDHPDIGIGHVKLGQLLAAMERPAEARRELEAGLAILEAQSDPASYWVGAAREELAALDGD